MDIKTVIKYLNKEKDYKLGSDYYEVIARWLDWWKGFYAPFHKFTERLASKTYKERELYSLKMAKKVCEDWASMLLNEDTIITVGDDSGQELIDQVLEDTEFVQRGNELVEKAFASGTGAFVLRLEGALVKSSGAIEHSAETKIRMEYLPADYILPLTVKRGKIIDVAFASEVLRGGKKYVYLETHILERGSYTITNRYFVLKGGQLKEEPTPDDVIEVMTTGSDIPWFAIIKPNISNNVSNTPMGVSVFANAIDQLKGVDLAYNNFNKDFKLGGKKVFLSDDLVMKDTEGQTITPDDVAQQLFSVVGNSMLDSDKKPIVEHNPDLRVEDNVKGVQAQLDLLSFRCGMGTKYYQFTGGKIVTATEYTGERQDLAKNVHKHNKVLHSAIRDLCRAILYIGTEVLGQEVDQDAEIKIEFDDSFIRDSEAERAQDMQDVRDGVMAKWEYRAKWYGEDEETAKAAVAGNGELDPLDLGA